MKKGKKLSDAHKKKISESLKGKKLTAATKKKISEAKKGRKFSDATKKKLSEAHKGKKHSVATKKKMSGVRKGKKHSKSWTKNISEANKGKKRTDIAKKKMSASHQGIPYEKWEAFACEKKYCPKFDEKCRESNRNKYGRRCFICNKTEKANGQKLSVHHVDMQKSQGCESNWKLVPLCKHCHATAHNDTIIARLGYIIKRGK